MAGEWLAVVCTWQLLLGAHWTSAAPTTTGLTSTAATTVPGISTTPTEGWAQQTTLIPQVIWQITEDAGPTQQSEDILFRSGWTAPKKQQSERESVEGWLNSAVISKDALLPYRAMGLWERFGNDSDEWKKYLVTTSNEFEHERVPRIEHTVKPKSPFKNYTHLWKRIPSSTPKNA